MNRLLRAARALSLTAPAIRALLPVAGLLLVSGCAGRGDHATIIASGHVEATDVRVSAKVGGRILSLPLKEGDAVTPGQVLAVIDTVDLRLAADAARAARDQARAQLELAVNGARREDIAQAEAQVEAARATLDGAQKEYDRARALLDNGTGTTKARDDALSRRDTAAATLQAAREQLRKLKAGSRREEIESARAGLAAAEARLAQLGQQIADATVTAPLPGVISEKLVEAGEIVAAGAPLLVITNLGDAWLTVYIAETDLARIRFGQEARVRTDDGQQRTGRITFISSKAEFTPKNVQTRDERVKLVYRVKVGLPNDDGLFKPGMPAEAVLTAVSGANAGR